MESDLCFGPFSLIQVYSIIFHQNCVTQSEINTAVNWWRIYILRISIVLACAGAGGGSGGVPFEVWCRFYYPNVRDQVIAKVHKLFLDQNYKDNKDKFYSY